MWCVVVDFMSCAHDHPLYLNMYSVAAADFLTAYVTVGGGHVDPDVRAAIDSTVESRLMATTTTAVTTTKTREAVLRLGEACVAAPWRDGGYADDLLTEQLVATIEGRRRRSRGGYRALRLRDAVRTPRAPPLSLVRTRETRSATTIMTEEKWTPPVELPLSSPKKRKTKTKSKTKA